jgi:hypothetical protein
VTAAERKAAIDMHCKVRHEFLLSLARRKMVPVAQLRRLVEGASSDGQTWASVRRAGVDALQRAGLLYDARVERWPWGMHVYAMVTPNGRRMLWLHALCMQRADYAAPFPRVTP